MALLDSSSAHTSVKFTVEPQVLTQQQRPCVIYQEIRFAEPIKIEFITFRNFYCAFVSIHELRGEDEWLPILSKHRLMKNGHHENDAQNSHVIRSEQFIKAARANKETSALRFYLIQPSPNWTSFGLRDLMCYARKPKKENDESDPVLTPTLANQAVPQPLDIRNAALLFRALANQEKKK